MTVYSADVRPVSITQPLEHPSEIHRPVMEVDGETSIGFDPTTWEARFG